MTIGKSPCSYCGKLVPHDEHVNGKCMDCITPDEVTINEYR